MVSLMYWFFKLALSIAILSLIGVLLHEITDGNTTIGLLWIFFTGILVAIFCWDD